MAMTDIQSSYSETETTFRVEGYERIDFSLHLVEAAFGLDGDEIASSYRRFGRCLAIVDANVQAIYGEEIETYFEHHSIDLTVVPVRIAETEKSLASLETIVDALGDFGLLRKEPVLVIGGGLTTDVAGFACATYRRGTNYIRVPTTLIGLVDASVAIKVAVNHGHLKNRLGAYHPSAKTILDFSFLRSLPEAEVRNGMAELVKIATVANRGVFELLDRHGEELLRTRFANHGGDEGLRAVAEEVNVDSIRTMLDLEVPNLHELDLDRVIAFGHTWSPILELAPEPPMLHGHGVCVDMAFSTTLAERRGYISGEERERVLSLMSRLGLAIDSPYLTADLLAEATESILKTRDGRLRAAVPRPIGSCHFVNDAGLDEFVRNLEVHRELCGAYPREGAGEEMFTRGDAADRSLAQT
jgi:3-dehydroquinate synthetase